MRLLALAVLALSTTAQADTSVTFGGWSKHSDAEIGDYVLNESHKGLGLSHYFDSDNKHSYGVEFWFMRDSHDNPARHYGINYKYTLNERFSFVLSGMYMDRTFRENYEVYRKQLFTVAPYITINVYKNLSVDVSYMPKLKSETGVLFLRGSYRF